MKYFYVNNEKFIYNIEFKTNFKNNRWKKTASLIEYCENLGFNIPHYCYHKHLSIAGNCRMCLIEIKNLTKPSISCTLNAQSLFLTGTKIFTDSPLVKKARESVLEFLLLNHPLDCPVCDQAGECDLQDQSLFFGFLRGRFYKKPKRIVLEKELGAIIKTVMSRCIHCTRCVRFSSEIAGVSALGVLGRGSLSEIGTYVPNKVFQSELSGNVIDICPVGFFSRKNYHTLYLRIKKKKLKIFRTITYTLADKRLDDRYLFKKGALTSKPYPFEDRDWECKVSHGIDLSDGFGLTVQIFIKDNNIRKIVSSINEDRSVNWITDKGRFFFDGMFSKNRNFNALIENNSQEYIIKPWKKMFKQLLLFFYYHDHLNRHSKKKMSILIIIDETASLDVLCYLIFLTKKYSFIKLKRLTNYKIINNLESYFQLNTPLKLISLKLIRTCLLVGVNTRYEGSTLNLKLRQRFLKGRFQVNSVGSITDHTFPIKLLGTSIKTFIDLVEGKKSICQTLKNSKKLLLILNLELFKRIDVKNFKNIISVFKKCTSIQTKYFNGINILNSSINSVGLNILTKFKSINIKDFLNHSSFYLINSKFKKGNINKFAILKILQHISFIDKNEKRLLIDQTLSLGNRPSLLFKKELSIFNYLILPNNLNLETASSFINTEGYLKNIKRLITPKEGTKNDWQIIRTLHFLLNFLFYLTNFVEYIGLNIKKINNIKNLLNFLYLPTAIFSPNSELNYKTQNFKLNKIKFPSNFNKFYNTNIKKWIEDFYVNIANYNDKSTVMVQCSYLLRKEKTNFYVAPCN